MTHKLSWAIINEMRKRELFGIQKSVNTGPDVNIRPDDFSISGHSEAEKRQQSWLNIRPDV